MLPCQVPSSRDRRHGLALTDNRGPNTITLTFTPGFRTYLGGNLYLFGGVALPATKPKPFDYQVLGELLMPY
jgi:hypothetical protein